jgi:RNA polymerase sigma factor (sigma-70 family)
MTPNSPAPTPDDPRRGAKPASSPRAGARSAAARLAQALQWTCDLVRSESPHWHLQAADIEDAFQEAATRVALALERYDPLRRKGPEEVSLHALVNKVASGALIDYLRARKRARKRVTRHYETPAEVERLLVERGGGRLLVSAEKDPVLLAELHEMQELVDLAVCFLSDDERRLFDLWMSGATLKAMARQLGVTVKVVRQRKEQLMAKIRALVRSLARSPRPCPNGARSRWVQRL